jgi:hypothetical protein
VLVVEDWKRRWRDVESLYRKIEDGLRSEHLVSLTSEYGGSDGAGAGISAPLFDIRRTAVEMSRKLRL